MRFNDQTARRLAVTGFATLVIAMQAQAVLLDDFEGHAPGNINDQDNGNVHWFFNPAGSNDTAVITNLNAISGSQSLQYESPSTSGSTLTGEIAPEHAIGLLNDGDTARVRFYYRSVGDVESFAFKSIYGSDANRTTSSTLANSITYGVSGAGGSTGNFFADNGAVQEGPLQPDTWYLFELSVERVAGTVSQALRVFKLDGTQVAGTAPGPVSGPSLVGFEWLAGLTMQGSSAPGNILIDDVQLGADAAAQIQSVAIDNATALTITSELAVTYSLEAGPAPDGPFSPVGATVTGNGGIKYLFDPNEALGSSTTKIYRVISE